MECLPYRFCRALCLLMDYRRKSSCHGNHTFYPTNKYFRWASLVCKMKLTGDYVIPFQLEYFLCGADACYVQFNKNLENDNILVLCLTQVLLGVFAKCENLILASSCLFVRPYVCLSSWNNSTPTDCISMEFDI